MGNFKIRRIDVVAVAFIVILWALITIIASIIIALFVTWLAFADESPDTIIGGGFLLIHIFQSSVIFLSPLWIWLAFKLRKVINWPRNAFEFCLQSRR